MYRINIHSSYQHFRLLPLQKPTLQHHQLSSNGYRSPEPDDDERGRKEEGRLIIRSEGLQSQLGGLWTSDSASRLRWTAGESRRCLWRSKSREVDPLWVLPERRSLVVGDWRGGGFGCGCRGVLFVDWYVDSLVYRSRMGMIGAWSEYRLDWGLYSTKRVCWTQWKTLRYYRLTVW